MGFLEREKTFSQFEYVRLLEPCENIMNDIKRQLLIGTSTMSQYSDAYIKMKQNYQFKYNLSFLEKYDLTTRMIGIDGNLNSTAIIPLKENGTLVPETRGAKRYLRKAGIEYDSLQESLEEPADDGTENQVQNAYIVHAIPLTAKTPATIKALADSFIYYANGQSRVDVSFETSGLLMSYSYNINKQTVSGVIGKTGFATNDGPSDCGYIKEEDDNTEDTPEECENEFLPSEEDCASDPVSEGTSAGDSSPTLVLKVQRSRTEYEVVTITNYEGHIDIDGKHFHSYSNNSEKISRLLMPLDVFNDLKFKEFVYVHQDSYVLIAFASETVKLKWYQHPLVSFIFSILLSIIFNLILPGAGQITAELIKNVIIDAAISYAISYGISFILGSLSENLKFILQIAIAFIGIYNDLSNLVTDTIENFLPTALDLIHQASEIYEQLIGSNVKKAMEANEANNNSEEEEASARSVPHMMSMDAHHSFAEKNSQEAYFMRMYGENMMNFDQLYDVTGTTELRKQVVSG